MSVHQSVHVLVGSLLKVIGYRFGITQQSPQQKNGLFFMGTEKVDTLNPVHINSLT